MKININNKEKIEKVLATANKGCSQRLASYKDIQNSVKEIEESLIEKGIHKYLWPLLYFSIQPGAGSLPNSYYNKGYFPKATSINVIRGVTGWFVTGAFRGDIENDKILMVGHFNELQKEAIIKKSEKF